jgi:hypothetical protein
MKLWKTSWALLVIAALCPAWIQSSAAVDEPGTAKPSAPDTPKKRSPDFANPMTAVTTFLTALKTGDRRRLAEIISIYVYAPTDAPGETRRKLLAAIREETVSDAEIKQLASAFEGYEIVGQQNMKASGVLGVYVRKRVVDGVSLLRTITTRHERMGWKILDFSEPKQLEKGAPYAAAEQRHETSVAPTADPSNPVWPSRSNREGRYAIPVQGRGFRTGCREVHAEQEPAREGGTCNGLVVNRTRDSWGPPCS